MFGNGNNPFGQSSSTLFGSQPDFGQNNVNSNPFAPQPFGSTNPFNSTGVFKSQSSSPLGSTSVFGTSPSPAFVSSTPTFGASYGSSFGNSSSAFGGSSASGGFGSTNTQTSIFESSIQQSQPQSQPDFGSSMFGSSALFGAPSQPAFGSSTSPAIGAQTSSAFGGFGSTNTQTSPFGSSIQQSQPQSPPAFGSSMFGSSALFGAPSQPAFGSSTGPAFGAITSSAFGGFGSTNTQTSPFGSSIQQSQQAFGSSMFGSSTPFGAPSQPAFCSSTSPAFGAQTSSDFGGFGSTNTLTSPFGSSIQQSQPQSQPAFGSSMFGSSALFGAPSQPAFGPSTGPAFGAKPSSAFGGFGSTNTHTSPFGSSIQQSQPQSQPAFGSSMLGSSALFGVPSQPAFGSSTGPAFGAETSSDFGGFGSPNTQTSPFGSSIQQSLPAFGSSMFGSSTPFGAPSQPAFGSSTSPAFGAQTSSDFGGFGSTNTQTSPFGSSIQQSQPQSQPAFGSSLIGSSTPFGAPSQPAFGPSTSPAFGAQTSSDFGGFGSTNTHTSPFGSSIQQSQTQSQPASGSSMFGSSALFGAPSQPAFGSSTGPAFGAETSSAFGGFGSTNTHTSPFGSSIQQSQPAFGSSMFGSSTPFGAPSQPAFGSSTSPAFGAQTSSAFGGSGSTNTQTSPFGSSIQQSQQQSQPAFGSSLIVSSTPFGAPSQPAFGPSTSPGFGAQTSSAFCGSPAFGSSTVNHAFGGTSGGFGALTSPFGASTPTFGASTSSLLEAPSTPAFGATSSPEFGATTTPAFGAPSTPSFNFGSSPTLCQSISMFGNTSFGASSIGAQASSFGTQTSNPAFGNPGSAQSTFREQQGGSRVSPYSETPDVDASISSKPAGKLYSISAMPVYEDKSQEEHRLEDHQLGDKGGSATANQALSVSGFDNTGFPSSSNPVFGQTSSNLFSSSMPSNPFATTTTTLSSPGFGTTSTPSAFGSSPFGMSNTSTLFGSTTAATPSLFGNTSQAFGVNSSSSLFSSSTTLAETSTPFGQTSSPFGVDFSSSLFCSSTTLAETSTPFGQTSSPFIQCAPGFGQPNMNNTPSTEYGNMFSSTSSLSNSNNALGFGQTTSSLATPFQSAQPSMSSGGFNINNYRQSQSANTSGFDGSPGLFNSNTVGQLSGTHSSIVAQALPIITNPFGTSIRRTCISPPVQSGISSFPIAEKPAPVRMSSSPLTCPLLPQRRLRPIRKYHPKNEKAYFMDDEEIPSRPKADASIVPRENPRSLVIRPMEQLKSSTEKRKASTPVHEDAGKTRQKTFKFVNEQPTEDKDVVPIDSPPENGHDKRPVNHTKGDEQKPNVVPPEKEKEDSSYIEDLLPKLRHSDYFTEPCIEELAFKERSEPGFCSRVKDFVVGRNGYGSIKFSGETDVRGLDLESIVQFNNREVLVYKDDSKKPPFGQGLNKPAIVTLCNIKCIDKKTGQHFTEGPRMEKYKTMLMRKAKEQGAIFESYDPVVGEWRFYVHFSGAVPNDYPPENGHDKGPANHTKGNEPKTNMVSTEKEKEDSSYIEALMPKLRHSDYFTEPCIQDLAIKERSEPGFCSRVKGFVVGRKGYGSIMFVGETDVRGLDIESIVQFNNREVHVYMDDIKKPPVGQGLNKPAIVTLCNIKCIDKKTGQHFTEGPLTEYYKMMLNRKAEEHGVNFVSYDPVKGDWSFSVSHF